MPNYDWSDYDDRAREETFSNTGAPIDFDVKKVAHLFEVPEELLQDFELAGPVGFYQPNRRERFVWWVARTRLRFGRWLGSVVAGERLYTEYESADWDDR